MENNQEITDGIYYIVVADMVGSTNFAVRMGDAALMNRIQTFVQASKKGIEHAKMSSNSGRFLKPVGDAVLLVFNHFTDIVQWQMEFEGALVLATSQYEPIQTRICVHAGEVRVVDGDVSNLAIHQAFKMEKSVRAGDLVLSELAYKLAVPSLYPKQCVFEEYGTVDIKGYDFPVKLYKLAIKEAFAFLIDKTGSSR